MGTAHRVTNPVPSSREIQGATPLHDTTRGTRHRVLAVAALLLMFSPGDAIARTSEANPSQVTTFRDHFAITPCAQTAPRGALCASGKGTGPVAALGAATEAVSGTVNLASPDPVSHCAPEFGTVTITAAGGQIMLHLTGQFCPTGPTTSTEVGFYVVTGGTGRSSGWGTYLFSGVSNASRMGGTAIHTYQGTLRARS